MDHNRAFRDFATRVSFNVTFSRNQVAAFRAIVMDLEAPLPVSDGTLWGPGRAALHRDRVENHIPDLFVMGLRWLMSNGFVREHPKIAEMRVKHERDGAPWQWSLFTKYHPYQLTEAGEHMAGLLRIAGLIPQQVANDQNQRKRKAG
jgi:hypothetical protein